MDNEKHLSNLAGYLGIDTSNYTTSAAFCSEDGSVVHKRRLLKVNDGGRGLQQSEAVFQHTKNLPLVIKELFEAQVVKGLDEIKIKAVGASVRPRDTCDSYMPCFAAGEGTARSISTVLRLPFYEFSHQAGHIAAALYSICRLELLQNPFIAFHVSGGTTEAVLCEPDTQKIITTKIEAQTLDLNAGQVIDRVGVKLGLDFPCGAELEKLALKSLKSEKRLNIKPAMKNADCCLSGLENICTGMIDSNAQSSDVAMYCLQYILAALDKMTEAVMSRYKGLPLLFAGGVMANSIIKEFLQKKYGAYFAMPEFSCDNAAGIAALTKIRHNI